MNLEDEIKEIRNNNILSTTSKIDKISMLYSAEGYIIGLKTDNQLQMTRKKTFSFLWAFLWLLVWGYGLIVYLLYYVSKKDDTYTITFPKEENIKDSKVLIQDKKYAVINKEFKNDTYHISIDECVVGDFNNIKNEIIEQYKALEYNEITMNKDDIFILKSLVHKRSYLNIKFKNQIVSIEAYNVSTPPFMYNSKKELDEEAKQDNIAKLIELSKLVEKDLLTKDEFESQKALLLN